MVAKYIASCRHFQFNAGIQKHLGTSGDRLKGKTKFGGRGSLKSSFRENCPKKRNAQV
jgi:hypothetical protein